MVNAGMGEAPVPFPEELLAQRDESPEHGVAGVFTATVHQAYRDIFRGCWHARLDAVRWLISDACLWAECIAQVDPDKFEAIATRYLPEWLVEFAGGLLPAEVDLLYAMTAGYVYDEAAAHLLREKYNRAQTDAQSAAANRAQSLH